MQILGTKTKNKIKYKDNQLNPNVDITEANALIGRMEERLNATTNV